MANLHVIAGSSLRSAEPGVRKIGLSDLKDALAKGFTDFWAMPTHVVFIGLIYPIIGIVLGRLTLGYDVLSLLFPPPAAGFARVGPFAAIGLYELSRRREQGLPTTWKNAFDVLQSPSLGAILVLGILLMIIFAIWLAVAQAIYIASFGDAPAASIPHFIEEVLTTPAGWTLIVVGNGVGFLFALGRLTLSVVALPLLLHRDVGAPVAVLTSVRAVAANPLTIAAWGVIVAALLLVGSLPFFIGLGIAAPVLGHAHRRIAP